MIKSKFCRYWRQCFAVISLWVFLIPLGHAVEERIVIEEFAVYQGGSAEKLIVDIRLDYHLTEYIREGLLNGITMRSEVRFDLVLHSDWWWNEKEALDSIVLDLKYNALSRQYQLASKKIGKNWNFSNLPAALKHIGNVRQYRLPSLPKKALEGEAAIYIEATMKPVIAQSLDIPSRLSSLFGNDDNHLVSQGVMWQLTPLN